MLGQSEASSQRLDSLGFSTGAGATDMAGKGGVGSPESGGLDSLSEYTLPGEWYRMACFFGVLIMLVGDYTKGLH